MLFERYNVEEERFPTTHAVVMAQIQEHVGGNLCIQLVYDSKDKSHKCIHNYMSVNDPSFVLVPTGLNETKDHVVMHFNRSPTVLCYKEYTTKGDFHFPRDVSGVILIDCTVNGKVFVPNGKQLAVEWKNKGPNSMIITTA